MNKGRRTSHRVTGISSEDSAALSHFVSSMFISRLSVAQCDRMFDNRNLFLLREKQDYQELRAHLVRKGIKENR